MHTQLMLVENKNSKFVQNEFMIKAIIVADGSGLMDNILGALKTCCPHLEIAGFTNGIKSGVAAINKYEPDLVLLDTRLSDGSGFDLVRHFDKPDFKIIFISSSIDYAVKAIKFNAIDYIIKPIDEEELTLAVNKAVEIIRFEESLHQKALGESINNLNKIQRLVLKASDQVHVVNIADIIRIEADSNYSTFHMLDGRQILISKALKEYEESLLEHGFHRIHKSHLFNINKMSHLDKVDGGYVIMVDGSRVPVSSRKKDMLLELFNEMK
ncbi:MAG: LytTR family DNA-binding domain-containing protein [Bacteroidales bacterium]|nr:LytTR family DNA-binding domain-containing protein [Bacteroidales bacterium]